MGSLLPPLVVLFARPDQTKATFLLGSSSDVDDVGVQVLNEKSIENSPNGLECSGCNGAARRSLWHRSWSFLRRNPLESTASFEILRGRLDHMLNPNFEVGEKQERDDQESTPTSQVSDEGHSLRRALMLKVKSALDRSITVRRSVAGGTRFISVIDFSLILIVLIENDLYPGQPCHLDVTCLCTYMGVSLLWSLTYSDTSRALAYRWHIMVTRNKVTHSLLQLESIQFDGQFRQSLSLALLLSAVPELLVVAFNPHAPGEEDGHQRGSHHGILGLHAVQNLGNTDVGNGVHLAKVNAQRNGTSRSTRDNKVMDHANEADGEEIYEKGQFCARQDGVFALKDTYTTSCW